MARRSSGLYQKSQLLLLAPGAKHRLLRVGMVARVPNLGGYRHGRGREVLHLLQVEIQAFGDDGQLCHVFLMATGMAGDEIRDELLAESCLLIDAVEQLLERLEQAERRLAHDAEHAVGGMFGSHLETPANVAGNELARIVASGFIQFGILVRVQEQVIAHATPDERLLDARQGIHGPVNVGTSFRPALSCGTYLHWGRPNRSDSP